MIFKYFEDDINTKNRVLVLKEYDDDGNLLEEREFDKKDLASFIGIVKNEYEELKVARYEYLKQFTKEELDIIRDIMFNMAVYSNYNNGKGYVGFSTENEVEWYKKIIKFPKEMIEFALSLSDCSSFTFNVAMKSDYFGKRFSFIEAMNFIIGREGIYYTINNEGKRVYDFIDKPTLKQYKYQIRKNGHRTVYLDFNDWKEYIVNESNLNE